MILYFARSSHFDATQFPNDIFFSTNCYFRDDLQILAYTFKFYCDYMHTKHKSFHCTLHLIWGLWKNHPNYWGQQLFLPNAWTLSFLQIDNLEPFFLGTEDNHNSIILHFQRQPLYNYVAGHGLKILMFTTMELKAKTKVTLVCLQ